jgi:toxin YoeB
MNLAFTPSGWADYVWWQSENQATLKRINRLLDQAPRNPRHAIGKPEPLKYQLGEVWSRRITEEHRLTYLLDGDQLIVLQARFHQLSPEDGDARSTVSGCSQVTAYLGKPSKCAVAVRPYA